MLLLSLCTGCSHLAIPLSSEEPVQQMTPMKQYELEMRAKKERDDVRDFERRNAQKEFDKKYAEEFEARNRKQQEDRDAARAANLQAEEERIRAHEELVKKMAENEKICEDFRKKHNCKFTKVEELTGAQICQNYYGTDGYWHTGCHPEVLTYSRNSCAKIEPKECHL